MTEENSIEQEVTESPEASVENVEETDTTTYANGELIEVDYLGDTLFDDIKVLSESPEDDEDFVEGQVSPEVMSKYNETISDIRRHQIIQGRVIGGNDKEIIVDIGFKSEGIIHKSEFVGKEVPSIGDVIDVYLEYLEDRKGQTILSIEKAEWMKSWNKIIELFNSGETVLGTISRRIKGGMVVDVENLQGFLPGSQIDIHSVQDFDQYLNKEMEFKIVKVNELRKNIVLSRKALLEDSLNEKRQEILQGIEIGNVLEGIVKNITDFGVFIDLGGVDGLLHITDLSWGRIKHPSEVVKLGETINVKVIDYDKEKQRISLGLKQLTPHPWDSVNEKYPVGGIIKGKVVSMTNYGAFIEIEKGVEGLVHISEMSWTRGIHNPTEVVQLGNEVEAQILNINEEERKIALGFKQLQPNPWDSVDEKFPVESVHKGIVRNLTQFGAFVELEEGIDGLIHISDMSWTKVVRHPKEIVQKSQEVEVKVLDISKESQRISLGLKQLESDPWEEIEQYFETGKTVTGIVIRVLDKGVILQLEKDVEGIIPSRSFKFDKRKEILATFVHDSEVSAIVVEVRPEDKKIILNAELTEEVEIESGESATEPVTASEEGKEEVTEIDNDEKQPEEVEVESGESETEPVTASEEGKEEVTKIESDEKQTEEVEVESGESETEPVTTTEEGKEEVTEIDNDEKQDESSEDAEVENKDESSDSNQDEVGDHPENDEDDKN